MPQETTRWQLSVFYAHLREAAKQRGLPLLDVCRRARELGVAYVELSEEELIAAEAEGCRVLVDSGLRIGCVYKWFDFGHDQRQESTEALVDRAVRAEVRDLLVVPGFLTEKDDRHDAMERMADCVEYLCDYADERGVRVGLEDFDGATAPYATLAEVRWFLERVPKLRFTLDTGNFLYSGEDVLAALDALGERIGYVHLKDRRRTGEPGEAPQLAADGSAMYASPVGGGIIPMETILRKLQALDYRGKLAIEHFGAPDQLRCLEESVRWLQRELAKLEECTGRSC